MDHIKLVRDKIDINLIQKLIVDETCGACSLFVGTTRDNHDGKKVLSLEYEAYENMALKEMGKILSELRGRWPSLKNIAIYHRLGSVPVTEESVVIGVSAPHRQEALESVCFAIDQLKTHVPIWKKEIYENDHIGEWKANAECHWPQYSETALRTFEFTSCKIGQTVANIPDKLVQIRVDDIELNRRVKCFLQRKRDEINQSNINDFKALIPESCTDSCARTQSFLIKQQQASGHLKVRRALNVCGPQLRPDYSFQLKKLMTPQENLKKETSLNKIIENTRLQNIEDYMHISPEGDDILYRIRNIENRILMLESSSPEYKCFVQFGMDSRKTAPRKSKKEIYMSDALNDFINNIKKNL